MIRSLFLLLAGVTAAFAQAPDAEFWVRKSAAVVAIVADYSSTQYAITHFNAVEGNPLLQNPRTKTLNQAAFWTMSATGFGTVLAAELLARRLGYPKVVTACKFVDWGITGAHFAATGWNISIGLRR